MTIRIAMLIFVVSFAAITGWLVTREPADNGIAQNPPAPEAAVQNNQEPIAQEKTSEPEREVIAISDAERYIKDKLSRIRIPLVEFENTSVEEAMDYIRLRSRELDPAAEESRKGISFIIRKPPIHSDDASTLDTDLDAPPHPIPTVTGRLENKSITEVLDFICEQAGCRWQITNHGILIAPLD